LGLGQLELVEQTAPVGEIDASAVIRIDETQIPELGSLINIRNSRCNYL